MYCASKDGAGQTGVPRVDVGEMKKVTAVVTKATPTHAAETKAENKQKREGGRKPNTVPAPSSSSIALCPTSDGVDGVRSLNTADVQWLAWLGC